MLSDVPQGSILGLLLFLLYINDLPEQIDYASCYFFANNTKLLKSIRAANNCLMLQADVDTLDDWCEKWKLKLNAVKCNILKMSLSHQEPYLQHQYHINGTNLQSTSCQRDLGIMASRDLSWSNHYNKICLKAYKSLNLIRPTLPPNSSTKLKTQVYFSLVKSHMSYCSQLWRPQLIRDI